METSPGAAASFADRRPVVCGIAYVAVFFAAVLFGMVVRAYYVWFPLEPDLAVRFQYFAERKDDIDTLFIGSSRIFRHVIPQQYDKENAQGGRPTHSLNLGYPGMWIPESFCFLRQALALHPRHLRYVVIELMDYMAENPKNEEITLRSVAWHDWQHTVMAVRIVLVSAQPAAEKRRLLGRHISLFAEHLLALGQAADWSRRHIYPAPGEREPSSMARGGFVPQERGEWSESRRSDYLQSVDDFERCATPPQIRPGLISAMRKIIQDAHRAGAATVFVRSPSVRLEEKMNGFPHGMEIWAFDDPEKFSELYQPELHFDAGHLNEDGARRFTHLLSLRFLSWSVSPASGAALAFPAPAAMAGTGAWKLAHAD